MKRKTSFLAKALLMLFVTLFSFTGARAQQALPYEYGFEDGLLSNDGWTKVDCATSTGINSDAKLTGNKGFQFYYNKMPPQYLISPELTGTESGVTVTFSYKNPGSYTETFKVGYSTTTAETDAFTWDDEITSPKDWTVYENTFPAGTKYVAVAYTANDQLKLYLDDFSFTVPAAVKKPTGLKYALIPGDATQAILSWTEEGTATAWQICLNDDETNLIDADSNPFTLIGLTPETVYTAKVRSVVGGEYSGWSNTVTFAPTNKTVIGSGTATSGYLPTCTYYNQSLTQQIYTATELGDAAYIFSIDFFSTATERTRNLNIYMVSTDKESFESATDWIPVTDGDLVFSGEVTFAANAWTTITLDSPFNYNGTQNVAIVVDDNTGSYVSSPAFLVFDATAQAIRVYSDNTDYNPTNPSSYNGTVMDVKNQIRLLKGEAPAVAKPTGLKVSYTGGTEATVSWVSDATAFDMDVNGVITENVANPTTLTGLELATKYVVKVRAKNGTDVSDWTSPVTFNTDLSDDMCQIQLVLSDTYGDGWNGNAAIVITDVLTGIEIGSYTVTSAAGKESQTFVVNVPNGRDIQFTWKAGSYDGECVYAAYDVNGEEIFSGTGAMSAPVTYTVDCKVVPWKAPSDLAASEITSTSVKLSWTENSNPAATAWVVAVKTEGKTDFEFENAKENPYVLENLKPETTYTVKVRPDTDEAEKWSAEFNFTTSEVYPKPTEFAASEVTAKSVVLSWKENGTATRWVIMYYPVEDDEDVTNIETDENPYTLTGLTPETTYEAYVRPFEGTNKWSDKLSFTTDVAYPAPTDVVASNVTSNSATISWTGTADSYNLRYRAARGFNYDFETAEAFAVDDFSPCTTYDGDGLSTYGITGYSMPNANYTGSVIAFSDNSQWAAHSGNTMGAFMDAIPDTNTGITANDDYFILPELTIASGDHFTFWARSVTSNYGLERIKVGIYGGSGTFSSYLAGDDASYVEVPVDWTEFSYDLSAYVGQTIQLAINCVSADAFALFIDDLFVGDPTDDSWDATLTDVTSPYVLNGLSSETKYEVQVQSVYTIEDSGESTWVATNFRTISNNPVPYNIEADLAADGATFTWTGEGDSYNVQYRTPESRDTYYFNDFNNTDVTGWTYSGTFIYGIADPIYNVDGTDNYFLSMGWSSTDEEIIISSELPEYESGARVEFYYFGYSTSNTFQVGFSTTTNDADAFTWNSPIDAPLQTYTLYSEELAAGVKYVAFKATASEQYACIFIDDFGIFSPTTPAGAWQEMAVTGTTATISGLATNNAYEYQIQSVKGGETSAWSDAEEFALVTLANDADNTSLINKFDGKFAHVTLDGRTLYKDGKWNTLTVPFTLTPAELAASPLAGADIRTLNGVAVSGKTATLNFTDEGAIESAWGVYYGGVPYLVKWDADADIVNPEFANVTIESGLYNMSGSDATAGVSVAFKGTYAPVSYTAEDQSILFVGAENKLYWPLAGATIGAQRAYFQIEGTTAEVASSSIKEFIMNFGDDDATGISLTPTLSESEGDWYDLSGRKLAGKPSMKGIYVNGGRKVTVK